MNRAPASEFKTSDLNPQPASAAAINTDCVTNTCNSARTASFPKARSRCKVARGTTCNASVTNKTLSRLTAQTTLVSPKKPAIGRASATYTQHSTTPSRIINPASLACCTPPIVLSWIKIASRPKFSTIRATPMATMAIDTMP